MKINLSLLSKHKSLIGFQIEYGGYLKRNQQGFPVLVRTIECNFGFLFGWLSLAFNTGSEINLDDINKSLRAEVMKGKTIDSNE